VLARFQGVRIGNTLFELMAALFKVDRRRFTFVT
jgi:hypothetical protein